MLQQTILWFCTVGIILIFGIIATNCIIILIGIKKIFSEIDNVVDEIGFAIKEKIKDSKSIARLTELFEVMLRHAMCRYATDNPRDILFHPFHAYHIVAMDTAVLFKVEHPDLFG